MSHFDGNVTNVAGEPTRTHSHFRAIRDRTRWVFAPGKPEVTRPHSASKGGADWRCLPQYGFLMKQAFIALDNGGNGRTERRILFVHEQEHFRSFATNAAIGLSPLPVGLPDGEPFGEAWCHFLPQEVPPSGFAHRVALFIESEVQGRPYVNRPEGSTGLLHRNRCRSRSQGLRRVLAEG